MNPKEFLEEEFANVASALDETLRHDYGASESKDFFGECRDRLARLRALTSIENIDDVEFVSGKLNELSKLANRISLIERSHLGEFSWPFSLAVKEMAGSLLIERVMKAQVRKPIIHVVAQGTGYQIVTDYTSITLDRRIAIVAFPRQLKHHVLLHAIFGHELAHAAKDFPAFQEELDETLLNLSSKGSILGSAEGITAWLDREDAPGNVRAAINGKTLDPEFLEGFKRELACDLVGLLLFGPGFVAAHRTIIQPTHADPYACNHTTTSHPPYAVRRNMLVAALKALGWDKPITAESDGRVHQAELAFLSYVSTPDSNAWANVVTEEELTPALEGLKALFDRDADRKLVYVPPTPSSLVAMVGKLARGAPPLVDLYDGDVPSHGSIHVAQCLHAGWVYWEGRKSLGVTRELSFLQTNQLCEHALLQQRAITVSLTDPPL